MASIPRALRATQAGAGGTPGHRPYLGTTMSRPLNVASASLLACDSGFTVHLLCHPRVRSAISSSSLLACDSGFTVHLSCHPRVRSAISSSSISICSISTRAFFLSSLDDMEIFALPPCRLPSGDLGGPDRLLDSSRGA